MFFGFIPKTFAESIPIKDGTFGVSYGGSYAIPTNFFSIAGGATITKELYLYNYEGYSRPYTYVVLEFCSGNVDLIRNAYISNANFTGNWINDGKGVTYVTSDTCTNASYTGYVIKKQLQIGKYEDMDGTGEELVASAYLNIKSNLSYYSWFRLTNVYLSSDDEISVLAQNQQDTQELISKIEQSSTSIVQSQEQVKQKLDSLNSSIGQTNDKLDNINDFLNDSDVNTDGLQNSAGWLPAGPVDSILNLPLSLYENLLNTLEDSSSCPALNITLPFIDKELPIPCLSDIFSRIEGLNVFWTWVGTISGAFILFNYLIYLYKWVDDTLTLRENTHFGGY